MINRTITIEQYHNQCSIHELWDFIESSLEIKHYPKPMYWVTTGELKRFKDKNSIWVSMCNNRIVGCIVMNRNTIEALCVRKRYRKNGIGKNLVNYCENVLKCNKRIKCMYVWSMYDFKAKGFYEKIGFSIIHGGEFNYTWHLKKNIMR